MSAQLSQAELPELVQETVGERLARVHRPAEETTQRVVIERPHWVIICKRVERVEFVVVVVVVVVVVDKNNDNDLAQWWTNV